MDLVVGGIDGDTCRGTHYTRGQMAEATVGGFNHAAGMVSIGMIGEVVAMANGASATTVVTANSTIRHGNGLTIGGLQDATDLMAGGTGVMYFIIACTKRYP